MPLGTKRRIDLHYYKSMITNDKQFLSDLRLRWKKIQTLLRSCGADACLITTNVNLYYTTGAIYAGYLYLPAEGDPHLFIRRPVGIEHPWVTYISKPEQLPVLLAEMGVKMPEYLILETDELTYNEVVRLQKAFEGARFGNATALLRQARITKTPWEIEQFRVSATQHAKLYARVRACYRPDMTDIEFQYELERESRALGSLGLFRGFGSSMDIFMGSVLTGDNAEAASPFDFALGGGGLHPSLPIGANGSLIKEGCTLMVDIAGNYTAYISDMTRVFSRGKLPDIAYKAHSAALDMVRFLETEAKQGYACADIFNKCLAMAEAAGLAANFMGTKQQAKFVGHGIGLQINELPVLTPRSKELLEENMVFAFEPKFVLPGIGAVGVENSYLVTASGLEKLTVFEEDIIPLEG